MKESKHTPAPWVVDYDKDHRPVGITAPNDLSIPGAVGHVVRRNGIGLPSSETAKANAQLIAAAPDLLEVLERALEHSNCPGDNCAIDWHAQARVVIAKAKGE